MITEDFVSFESARLLKEKGFNEKVICYYDDGGSLNLNKFVEFQFSSSGVTERMPLDMLSLQSRRKRKLRR